MFCNCSARSHTILITSWMRNRKFPCCGLTEVGHLSQLVVSPCPIQHLTRITIMVTMLVDAHFSCALYEAILVFVMVASSTMLKMLDLPLIFASVMRNGAHSDYLHVLNPRVVLAMHITMQMCPALRRCGLTLIQQHFLSHLI